MEELRPVRENFLWRNFTFATVDVTNGVFATGRTNTTLILQVEPSRARNTDTLDRHGGPVAAALVGSNFTWSYYRWVGYWELAATRMAGGGRMYQDANDSLFLEGGVRNFYGPHQLGSL